MSTEIFIEPINKTKVYSEGTEYEFQPTKIAVVIETEDGDEHVDIDDLVELWRNKHERW